MKIVQPTTRLLVVSACAVVSLGTGVRGSEISPTLALVGSSTASSAIRLELVENAFGGELLSHRHLAFDAVASDMDQDGDIDLLVNWHHKAPMELFENRGGHFSLINTEVTNYAGLHENPWGSIYATNEAVEDSATASEESELYVWREPGRRGPWRFLWDGAEGSAELKLVTSLQINNLDELRALAPKQIGTSETRILLQAHARHRFDVESTGQLDISLSAIDSEDSSLRVGCCSGDFGLAGSTVWRPDPHGMAWVDVAGCARPELYVTRGALQGKLRSPAKPKTDRFYGASCDEHQVEYAFARPGTVPSNYCRGRRVEWVDVDGDGSLELSVGNTNSANALLFWDGTAFKDRAPELGLDHVASEVHAWGDLNEDGIADLFYLAEAGVWVALGSDKGQFTHLPPMETGLLVPAGMARSGDLFNRGSIRFADYDADGDLDLLLLAIGRGKQHRLFRRDAAGYADVTLDTRFGTRKGDGVIVVLDLDNDRFDDLVSFGSECITWWRNNQGNYFEFHPLADELAPARASAAVPLDFDANGCVDIAVFGRDRRLISNHATNRHVVSVTASSSKQGALVGAQVVAIYSDGRQLVRRIGSDTSTTFSQMIQPLRFPVPDGCEIRELLVSLPGHPGLVQIASGAIAPGLYDVLVDSFGAKVTLMGPS